MCRIFGFRSVLLSGVHESLLKADNALIGQSSLHPDGWGVSYYLSDTPHLIKSTQSALNDALFKKVSGIVSSQTVMAHIRKATQGEKRITNSHPFQYGRWTFAHNGNINNFESLKDQLMKAIDTEYKKFILGSTDSEVFFHFLLSKISQHEDLSTVNPDRDKVEIGIADALSSLCHIIGGLTNSEVGNTENYLTFLLTNGSLMFGFHGGKSLKYSTYKTLCPERDTCPKFASNCESQVQEGKINHLIFSSEALSGTNIWHDMQPGELFSVNEKMMLKRSKIAVPFK